MREQVADRDAKASPRFFQSAARFRAWLELHAASADELLLGFRKIHTGRACLTWPEAVDEALCFGWIDGRRQRIDESSYQIRFTPRRRESVWSAINIDRIAVLEAQGRLMPAGREAFAHRSEAKSRIYSYEQRGQASFAPMQEREFKAAQRAWTYFLGQPPWYRKKVTWWITSAKQESTRARRLALLIEASSQGRQI